MTRTLPTTMTTAVNVPDSYYPLVKAELAASRIFFDSASSDNPWAGADSTGILDSAIPQEVAYNPDGDQLVTFYTQSGVLRYCEQGNSTPVVTSYASQGKPGVFGSTLYLYNGTAIVRYGIDWAQVTARSATPLTSQDTQAVSGVLHLHALSAIEALGVVDNDGGLSAAYWNGTTVRFQSNRFMFPKRIDWDGSSRTAASLGVFSGAAKLGNRVFLYVSNASHGSVEGVFFDSQTGSWGDIFTALPMDLAVSLCEFRVSNAYAHQGVMYLCGQFNRTDLIETSQPYSLLLRSEDGLTFSIDRNTMVSNRGFRFQATVGNSKLWLGHCNRVHSAPLTWVFDGNGDSYQRTDLSMDQIKKVADRNLQSLSMELTSAQTIGTGNLVEGARLRLWSGLKTTAGDEYVIYGTYLLTDLAYAVRPGSRAISIRAESETLSKLNALSMPFYAELFGKSSLYDPLLEASGKLYAAPNAQRYADKFLIDFWKHEGYRNAGEGITPTTMYEAGGVNYRQTSGAHKLGIITSESFKDILGLADHPVITATSITMKIYGWSHAASAGTVRDNINVVLKTADEDDVWTTRLTAEANKRWPQTWPVVVAGTEPIEITMSGLTVGHTLRRVGVIFESAGATWFNIARIEFVSGVQVSYKIADANLPWEAQDDGTFKVPGSGRPFIMFSQKPYNAWNFECTAVFENTTSGAVSGYPTACGIVGHAEDAANYTVGRYNKTNNKVEIAVCRNGQETVLASATPSFPVPDQHGVRFTHRNGTFEVALYNPGDSAYAVELSYAWEASAGFMYTSALATMKCGIYGYMAAPWVRIVGYYAGFTDATSTADGLPVDPLYNPNTFPTSGQLRIKQSVYSYDGIITHPVIPRGPYQLRQQNIYSPPYGNGSGLECRDFDWTASPALINGKLIALDSGDNYLASGAKWDIWVTTGGSVEWLRNRARYYSDNEQITKVSHSIKNKVWVVGGFDNVTLASGPAVRHLEGDIAAYEIQGELKCYWFAGAGGPDDTTVSDLITSICALAGGRATFPGDILFTTLPVSGTQLIYTDEYADGFDLRYETASPTTHEIRTNIKVDATGHDLAASFVNDTGSKLVFTYGGSGAWTVQFVSTPSNTVLYSLRYTTQTNLQTFRVLFHEKFVSIYHNYKWRMTVPNFDLIYGKDISMTAAGTVTLANLLVRDIGDWREAIYIDLETDGKSALGSVIQERPVEVVAQPDGALAFLYEFKGSPITLVRAPRERQVQHNVPRGGASDAIVYGSTEVKTLQNPDYASLFGFGTRLFRLPNLDVGAYKAAHLMLKKALESRVQHEMVIRPDPSWTIGDRVSYSGTLAGPETADSAQFIIEQVDFSISVIGDRSTSQMRLQGRQYD